MFDRDGKLYDSVRPFRPSMAPLTARSYLLVDQVVYLTICDKSYPRKLAFSYLDELSKEFQRSYESQIASANRPYSFRGFGECEERGAGRGLTSCRHIHFQNDAALRGHSDGTDSSAGTRSSRDAWRLQSRQDECGTAGRDADHDQEHGGFAVEGG